MGLYCVIDISNAQYASWYAYALTRAEYAYNTAFEVCDRGNEILDTLFQEMADEMELEEPDEAKIDDLHERIDQILNGEYAALDTSADRTIDAYDSPIDIIDTSNAVRAFQSAFYSTIDALCPVRTGWLKSTCRCISNGATIICMAAAEYAQYVEYGTSKMMAQPYFEPAIQAGIDAMTPELENMMDHAQSMGDSQGRSDGATVQSSAAAESEDLAGAIGGVVSFIAAIVVALVIAFINEIMSLIFDDIYEQGYRIEVF